MLKTLVYVQFLLVSLVVSSLGMYANEDGYIESILIEVPDTPKANQQLLKKVLADMSRIASDAYEFDAIKRSHSKKGAPHIRWG
jgi:hypothetical protein